MPSVKLQTSDGQIFEVDVDVAKVSLTIKNMLDDLGRIDEDNNEPIPLRIPNVTGAVMEKVIEWATHHKGDPPLLEDDDCKEKDLDEIGHWDKEYMSKVDKDKDHSTLFKLLQAADDLNIKGLLDITCKTVAKKIKGRKAEEIRTTFNIKNDFTFEEEKCIREESEWCENAC